MLLKYSTEERLRTRSGPLFRASPASDASGLRGEVSAHLVDTAGMFCKRGAKSSVAEHDRGCSVRTLCAKLFQVSLVLVALLVWLIARSSLAWDPGRLAVQANRYEGSVQQSVRALLDVVNRSASMSDEARLDTVNQFFNRRIFFREDVEVWGQVDYWASPLETLARGQGDCEDYAIAKYFSLLAAGVQPAKLRLVYVRAVLGPPASPPVAHMVLAYYPTQGAEPLILDNLVAEVLPSSRRRDLTPVFSFNTEGLWQGTQGSEAGDPLARLSRWREVVAKAREQGFL